MEKTFREQVIGTWKLLEYTRTNTAGERYYPLGKDATGFLIYTQDGYMSAQLMAQERPEYTLEGLHNGTLEEMARSAHGYHAYSGKYEVDEENQTLYHHMEVSLIPNRLGKMQDRKIVMDGTKITITSNATSSYIVWERAPDHSKNSL